MNEIELYLRSFHAGKQYRGFIQAKRAIEIALENEMALCSVVKGIYGVIALEYDCTWHAVERNIRSLLEHIWEDERGRTQLIKLFGYSYKPNISEFLDASVYHIRTHIQKTD